MKFIISSILLGVGIAGLIGGAFFPLYSNEIFLGMLSPLIVTIISILYNKKSYLESPQKLTSALIMSFIFKMLFFAIYVILIFSFYTFKPNPFIISFTGFFIMFYVIEAVFLQKLIQSDNE